MYGQYHHLPYSTGRGENLLGPLTIAQTFWIGLGVVLSAKFSSYLGPLGSLPFEIKYLLYGIPLLITAAFAFIRIKGLPLIRYIIVIGRCKQRKRVLR